MIKSDFNLAGRVALVTGASRGIGYHLALELAVRGAHIIALARTMNGLTALDNEIKKKGGSATLVPVDLNNMEAIDALNISIDERWKKLDILVANAAILGILSPIAHIENMMFENILQINLTSQWRLMKAVEPLLRKSDAGRAIFLSSSVAHCARPFWGPYAASKAALELLARCWAEELKQTSIKVNCVNPGATCTTMRAQAMPGEDPQTLPSPQKVAAEIAHLLSPHLKETGGLFDVRQKRFMNYHIPD
ncbi:oxidoreductase, short-chain dehydrogenase/reductase family [Bartonella clarridgeiae 73]|uniref:Oxidoreductase, short-chain dehydrogenase/reductase family n=1 Tax=Bartonella clarridgeiae (strain CCUG 45776 / CIP 104772 / 73) TaxID=696125 RepID=E6YH82_BARC7|nr:SDR family NAD(P)-dependent oxidoreductase [Bartonella clarridgeiae]WCR55200.1 MAG: Oxidoreductase short-chain dehydrogenase/reductase family [Bartonella clarridgeiae]CBI76220.1 oxidoreductase, short-chain dehydrogenase/reductase family [Bartonella clarridgeiae 73]